MKESTPQQSRLTQGKSGKQTLGEKIIMESVDTVKHEKGGKKF